MSELILHVPLAQHHELLEHLRPRDAEQVAFLFSEPQVDREALRIVELYPVPPEGFVWQSAYHVTLTDDVRAYVIQRATQLGGSLVEAHSHVGGDPVAFSKSDLEGFEEWVPHVRWRLRGRPYVALVFGDTTFDALVWQSDGPLVSALRGIDCDGDQRSPTDRTFRQLARLAK